MSNKKLFQINDTFCKLQKLTLKPFLFVFNFYFFKRYFIFLFKLRLFKTIFKLLLINKIYLLIRDGGIFIFEDIHNFDKNV